MNANLTTYIFTLIQYNNLYVNIKKGMCLHNFTITINFHEVINSIKFVTELYNKSLFFI